MLFDYGLSSTAEKDIDEIIDFIAQDNVRVADQFVDELYDSMQLLSVYPKMGVSRDVITAAPVRFWVFRKRYLVVYQEGPPLQIVRVLSGYRNVVSLIEESMECAVDTVVSG